MDALLILAGLLLFLYAMIWLVMRAFDTSLLWGWGSLIPPITLLYVFRQWNRARAPVVLAGLATCTLLVGLAQMMAQDPERIAAIFSLRWLHPEPVTHELQIQLDGKLNGQKFQPQSAELIDGALTLREGQDFYARRELIIRLPEQPQGAFRLDVLPQDRQAVPVIELSWLLPEQDLPEARRLTQGYSLSLDLQPLEPNKLSGDFHLVLPARFKTSLSGKLEVYTDHLRYRNGKLDATHDSRETLSKVIEDYLQRRFRTIGVELDKLPVISFPSSKLDINITARVNGQAMHLPLQLDKESVLGWQVANDRYPSLAKLQAPVIPASVEQPTEVVEERSILDRRTRFSLRRLLLNPNQYERLMMRVKTGGGFTAEGRFAGISKEGDIVILSTLSGAGEASFKMRPDEVISIELLEP